MSKLTKFVDARLDEAASYANSALNDESGAPFGWAHPEEDLDVIAAHRRLVHELATWQRENKAAWRDYSRWLEGKPTTSKPPARTTPEQWQGLEHAVRVLASVYADHPDYRPEWAPVTR